MKLSGILRWINPFKIIGKTTNLITKIIIIAVILLVIFGAYVAYPKRDNMGWNSQINEIMNSPDFECEFDSDCTAIHIGCGCAGYGACVVKGYNPICILPMGTYFCEPSALPENCVCIDNKCMTL